MLNLSRLLLMANDLSPYYYGYYAAAVVAAAAATAVLELLIYNGWCSVLLQVAHLHAGGRGQVHLHPLGRRAGDGHV